MSFLHYYNHTLVYKVTIILPALLVFKFHPEYNNIMLDEKHLGSLSSVCKSELNLQIK